MPVQSHPYFRQTSVTPLLVIYLLAAPGLTWAMTPIVLHLFFYLDFLFHFSKVSDLIVNPLRWYKGLQIHYTYNL